MGDPKPFSDKMREEWNVRAQKGFMQYTSGVESGSEADYQVSAQRDAAVIMGYLEGVNTQEMKALDVGCGVGRLMAALAPRFREIHGVDVSTDMLDKARARTASLSNVFFHATTGDTLTMFSPGSIDCMFSYSVFYHMPRAYFKNYMSECAKVLKSGGRMVFQLAQTYTIRRWFEAVFRIEPDPQDTNRRRFYTQGELRSIARRNGLEVLAIAPGPGHDLWCSWRKR